LDGVTFNVDTKYGEGIKTLQYIFVIKANFSAVTLDRSPFLGGLTTLRWLHFS